MMNHVELKILDLLKSKCAMSWIYIDWNHTYILYEKEFDIF